jgi:DNA (cytosine-5)-methyltransferase 1
MRKATVCLNTFNLFDEIAVDNFAGGGGASTGIEMALGRSPEIAINHDPDAIAMHTVNHPSTEHYCESVWDIVPRDVVAGRPVGLVWLSPDCKHFSKAKGSTPVSKKIRGLAWVALRCPSSPSGDHAGERRGVSDLGALAD